ncbi:MAG: hypothetical protein ACXACI_12265 [Candidatus Hodarchaeales archaeon]|jgi:hypothetical protein
MTSPKRVEDSVLSDLVFKALSHKFRRKLVFFLADAPAGFTELQEGMQCQTGTLYHHLRILGELVEQESSNRQWALTDTGWLAYRVLTTSQDDLEIPEMRKQALPALLMRVINILAPKRIFQTIENAPFHTIIEGIVLFIVFGWLLASSDLQMIVVFFDQGKMELAFGIAAVFLGWISLALVFAIISKLMTFHPRNKTEVVLIIAIVPFSMIPLALLPLIQIIGFDQPELIAILATILQIWVLVLLAHGLTVIFEIKLEKSLLVAVVTMYCLIAITTIFSAVV